MTTINIAINHNINNSNINDSTINNNNNNNNHNNSLGRRRVEIGPWI